MRLKGVFAGDATMFPWLRLRLLGKSSVEPSQPTRRDEEEAEEEEEEEEKEEEEEEEEAALLLTLRAFCLVRALESRDFLFPNICALQFLFPPSSIHCAFCAHS